MSKSKFRVVSLVAAGLIAFSGVSMPSIALAQAPGLANPTYSTVNLDAAVSLTIKKFVGDPGDTSRPDDTAVFTIEKVQLNSGNLDTAAAWRELQNLNAENVTIDSNFTALQVRTNNVGNGVGMISTGIAPTFKVGVYKVTEQNREGYTTAKPFLVTLPFVDNNGVWSYDQTVQPKNQTIEANKAVEDSGKGIGDTISYTLDSTVPGEQLSEFYFEDVLPKGVRMTGTPEVWTEIDGANQGEVSTTNYEVANTNDGPEGRNRITVTFNEDGRNTLSNTRRNQPALKVKVKINAEIVEIPSNSGTAQNGAYVNEARIGLPNGATKSTNTVQSRYGSLTITKNGTPTGNMVGAKFKLYECSQDGANSNRWVVADGAQPISGTTTTDVNGKTNEFEIVNGNTVTVNGIQDFEYRNGADVTDKKYCVVETKAPSGYNLNPNPQPVTKNPAEGSPYNMVATVEDVQDSIIGQLPATGEKGVFALMLAGLALLGGGVWARLRHNRKQANA